MDKLHMDKLQQQISDFQAGARPVLAKVCQRYDRPTSPKLRQNIKLPAGRLLQKCSCQSAADTARLCSLAYWLFICGDKELALEICELTHGVPFEFEFRDRGIQNIYGLEIRLARELLGQDRRGALPPALVGHLLSKRVAKAMRYPQVLREEEIAACSSRGLEIELLWALYDLIGKGETGLFPDINRNWPVIERAIGDYIAQLKAEL